MTLDTPIHPLIVHFPIVLAVLIPLLAYFLVFNPSARNSSTGGYLTVLSGIFLLTSLIAVQTGERDEELVERFVQETTLESHEEAGEKLPWMGVGLFALSLLAWRKPNSKWTLYGVTLLSTLILGWTVYVGHAGGELVYKEGAARGHVQKSQSPTRGGEFEDED